MTSAFDRIHHGDCISGLAQLDDGCIDLAFADPPFNIGYDYDEYDDRQAADDYLDWSKRWMAEIVRVLKPDGTFWLAIGDEYAAELKVMLTRELGMTCRSWVIWYYTFGVNCKYKFSRSHAHLFYMVKDAENFTFNADDPDVRVPSARQLVYADKRANPKGRLPDDTWITAPAIPGEEQPDEETAGMFIPRASLLHEGWVLRPQDLPEGFQPNENVWYFPRVNGTFKERAGWHGCQMPERLLGRIIRSCSNEGETVLDPFTGSGTTAAVAKKLGRRYLGYELSSEYAARAVERLGKIQPGDPLDGVEDPLTSVASTANGKQRRTPRKKRRPADEKQKELL